MAKKKMGANLHIRIRPRHKRLLQEVADTKSISLSNLCRKVLADAAEGSGEKLTNKLRWEALRQLFAKFVMADAEDARRHLAQIVQIFEGEDDIGMVLDEGDDDQG